MIRTFGIFTVVFLFVSFAQAQKPVEPKPVELTLEDQFQNKHSLADHRGSVVIFVYGDRAGKEAGRELGDKLHLLFHPSAVGQSPVKAKSAPVAALPGLPEGQANPDVVVVPVACAGSVPGPIKMFIRKGLKNESAETPVWIDFGTAMSDCFSLKKGEPNIAVIDAKGYLRLKVNGMPDKAAYDKIILTAQNLQVEAAGLK